MQAASEAGDKRRRKIVVAKTAAILVLLVVLVGYELRKSFGVTRLYNLATNEQPLDECAGPSCSSNNRNNDAVLPRTNVSRTEFVLGMQPRNDRKSPEAKDEKQREFKDNNNSDKKKKLSKEDKALLAERRNLEYAYKNQAERDARSTRFPAIHERVKLYMSNWYLPPCSDGDKVAYEFINSDDGFVLLRELEILHGDPRPRLFRVNAQFDGSRDAGVLDNVHFLNRTTMNATCSHRYCKDFMEFLFPALDRLDDAIGATTTEIRTPILYQFGDLEKTKAPLNINPRERGSYPAVPVLKKFRQALTADEVQRVTTLSNGDPNELCGAPQTPVVSTTNGGGNYHLQPIVFKLKTQRHYNRIYQVADADVPWNKKQNTAIFRGELTGHLVVNETATLSNTERCQLFPRCRLVFNHANSTLVDAKLAKPFANLKGIPESLNGIPLYGDTLSLEEMLRYKALIMLEGNDVSSGLKWALFSNSVVLMPAPTFTSWAMEELLQPWVHYVPITVAIKNTTSTTKGGDKETVTDVEEKMQWVLDHDEEAQEIARAGKLWISDLVLHPEAASDERAIFDEIVHRYRAHFAVANGLSET